MSRSKYFYKILLHVIAPLVAGLEIYLNGNYNTWLNDHLSFLRIALNIHPQNNWWHRILIYNVTDFCWDYSFASALFLWRRKTAVGGKYFPVFVCLLLMVSEAIQIFIPGSFTFDWLDMFAAVLAFSLSYFLNYVE